MRGSRREFEVWRGMVRSAYHAADKSYATVGGAGIGIHPPWRDSFENFFSDLGPMPPGARLLRRDDGHNFCPENCIWGK